ncbi:MAG: hypothetical protein EXS13_00455 [Planctomycetes bacterium]|nr:hypothetical protein [Planctomycetota bacterium]
MSTIAKVFTILNLVFSLIIVSTVGLILSKSEDWKAKHTVEVKAHADDVAAKQVEFEKEKGERATFESQNRTLNNQLADLRSENGTLTSSNEQARNDNNELRGSVTAMQDSAKKIEMQLADLEGRNKQLMDSNEQNRATAATAEKDKLDAQDDRARLEGDIKRANEDIAAKEAQMVALNDQLGNLAAERAALVSAGVDIAAIVGDAIPEINGKVSAVGTNFVVLSVGATEKVSVGTPFHVYRGNNYIGRVIVENVLPDSATARVTLKNKAGLEFQAGDVATTRL